MRLTLTTVLAMFVISSHGQVEKLTPEQDVKCDEKCEYPQSCSDCFEDIANVIFACIHTHEHVSLSLSR